MKRYLVMIYIFSMVVAPVGISAHEHWFVLDDFSPDIGDTISFSICTGHHFPSSSMALKDNVIAGLYLTRTGGAIREKLESMETDKARSGRIIPETAGAHIVVLVLKRPKAVEPAFEARAIAFVGEGKDRPEDYITGEGLEIVLAAPVSSLRKGNDLEVTMILDGKPVEGEIVYTTCAGKSIYRQAMAGQPALFPIVESGLSMICGSTGARECSLVFSVPDGRRE